MNLSPEILYAIGALVLLAALIWGFTQNRMRNRANDPLTDSATRKLYKHPDQYPQEKKKLEKEIRPS